MNKRAFILFVLALVSLTVWLASCTEDKIYDIVISDTVCPDSVFKQNSASEVFRDTVYVGMGAEVDSALARNGYSRSDISAAVLNGGYYTVTSFTEPDSLNTDWDITGAIYIQRTDVVPPEEVPLIRYTGASVRDAWGVNVVIPLDTAGVRIINEALADFLSPPYTALPQFRLRVQNGNCEPNPSVNNRIRFEWTACLDVQLIGSQTTSALDPF